MSAPNTAGRRIVMSLKCTLRRENTQITTWLWCDDCAPQDHRQSYRKVRPQQHSTHALRRSDPRARYRYEGFDVLLLPAIVHQV